MQLTKNSIIQTGLLALLAMAALFPAHLQAVTLAPVPGLSFVKPFAGADPLPQTITLASVAANFNVGTTLSTSSGGSWLSVAVGQGGCCYTTPHPISVIVTTLANMAVGTYNGQIVATSQDSTSTITIPVTLNVVATNAAFLDNLQGQMSFSMKTSGTAITSHDIQVRNGGPGTLNWTLTKSTSDGGNWLTVSGTTGTAPSFVTVGVTVANLPGGGVTAGTFIGQLVFSGGGTTITVPVAVVVGDNILAQVNEISFTKVFAGAQPLAQTLTFPSTGTAFNLAVTSYTATGGSWFAVSADGCCYTTPHASFISITALPTLPVGTYTGEVVISSQAGTQAITVPVTLNVVAAGATYFDNVAGQMSFSMKTGGTSITSQDIQIRNAGAGTLNYTVKATTENAASWITVSAPTGTAPSFITVSISVPNLPNAGLVPLTVVGELVFQTDGNNVTVPVNVTVGDPVLSQVNGLTFTKVFGGADPLPQVLTIPSTSTNENMSVTTTTATGGSWLTTSQTGCCYASPLTTSAIVAASPTLAVGTYTGQIVIVNQANTQSLTIPVTLIVEAVGTSFLDNMPGQLSFSYKTNTTGGPPSQTLQVRNAGTGPLDWTLGVSTSDGGNWLTASALSGTTPSNVAIGVVKGNLPGQGLIAGVFVGNLLFRTATSSYTVSVVFTIGDNILAQVNPIAFTMPQGGANPLPQVLTLPSLGANVNVAITVSTANGGNWLTASQTGCCYPTPRAIIISVTASPTMAAGVYTGQILYQQQNLSQTITVPVTLTVAPSSNAFFDNVQGQLSYFIQTAGGNPTSQNIQIRNGGSGTLNWGAVASTADGGNWLTVSTPAGTGPATETIGVVTNNLPNQGLIAGTFEGQVVLSAPGDSVTIPVSVIVGNNIFVQPAPLTFSKAFGATSPLPQTLNYTSGGSNFNIDLSAAAGTGGNYLGISPTGCCYVTPRPVTVTVTSAAGMAAGSYTGEVIAVAQSGAMASTVPVYFGVNEVIPGAPTLTAPANGATGVSTTPTLTWSAVPGATSYDVYLGTATNPPFLVTVTTASFTTSALSQGTTYSWRVVAKNGAGTATSSTFTFTTTSPTPPTLNIGPSNILNFHYLGALITTKQTVTVTFTGGSLAWTASSNAANITVSPASGTGNGTFNVTATPGGGGIVTVTAAGATGSPKQITVNVASTTGGAPFGSFDTPANNTSAIAGAIAVTGWGLDNVEIATVGIWRERVGSEPVAGNGLVFIGNAVLVDGARPDVFAANPTEPRDTRAGWGYLLLTNFLPNTTTPSGPTGNGTYKLHAILTNTAGQTLDLGAHTIVVDNLHAQRPFGTIDTPDQGGTIQGNQFVNFGWGLTQNPYCIATDGSTLYVTVDSVTLGHPTYNQNRSDIANAFPGLCNSLGAIGYFIIDTTTLANGVHTIGWLVYDNQGRGDGVGSRFFNVLNTATVAAPEEPIEPAGKGITLRTGYNLMREPDLAAADKNGVYPVNIEELGRMELHAGAVAGYSVVAGKQYPLPTGSSLRGGVFCWQLAPGFLGKYDLVLVQSDGGEVRVRVHVAPGGHQSAIQ